MVKGVNYGLIVSINVNGLYRARCTTQLFIRRQRISKRLVIFYDLVLTFQIFEYNQICPMNSNISHIVYHVHLNI